MIKRESCDTGHWLANFIVLSSYHKIDFKKVLLEETFKTYDRHNFHSFDTNVDPYKVYINYVKHYVRDLRTLFVCSYDLAHSDILKKFSQFDLDPKGFQKLHLFAFALMVSLNQNQVSLN